MAMVRNGKTLTSMVGLGWFGMFPKVERGGGFLVVGGPVSFPLPNLIPLNPTIALGIGI